MKRVRVVRSDGRSPVRGLPRPLPPGESLLWQGSPSFGGVFRRALHGRKIALYFAILMLWCAVAASRSHEPRLWYSLVALAIAATIVLGLAALYAALISRTTTYTVTDKRVVLTIGVALSASINLPFAAIERASARLHRDGTGDIPLLLEGPTRLGVFQLWPHARPWKLNRVEPMLRAVPDGAGVARLLAAALARSAGVEPVTVHAPVASADRARPDPAPPLGATLA